MNYKKEELVLKKMLHLLNVVVSRQICKEQKRSIKRTNNHTKGTHFHKQRIYSADVALFPVLVLSTQHSLIHIEENNITHKYTKKKRTSNSSSNSSNSSINSPL